MTPLYRNMPVAVIDSDGLFLAVVCAIAKSNLEQNLLGSMSCQSLPHATRHLSLPLTSSVGMLLVSALGENPPKGSSLMRRKILVVDDNLDTRELTHLHLTTEGFAVVIASDAREGLYMAVAEEPDLIIVDISKPELNGIDLIKQLRAQPELDNVPILVLTAFGSEEMDKAIRAGAYRAMNKPVHLDSLMDEVRQLLAESEPG